MADVTLKKGTTSPPIGPFVIVDPATGATANLTGATVKFTMRALTGAYPTTNLATATIVQPTLGLVQYVPTTTDTAAAGQYLGEFQITTSGGSVYLWPGDGYVEILIEEDLATPTPVGRLLSLGDVKDHLNIPASDRTHDAELIRFIDAITPVVEGITGPVVQRVYQDEMYDGGMPFISLRHRPIVAVHEVAEFRGPIRYTLTQVPTPDQGTIYSYSWEPNGRITRRTVGGGVTPFPFGMNQVLVTYTAGLASIPGNVRYGALELVRVNYQQTQQGGRPQYGQGASGLPDDFAGYQALGFFVPNRVRELLAPSRRHPSVV